MIRRGKRLFHENRNNMYGKGVIVLVSLLLAGQVSLELCSRYQMVFWEPGMASMTERLTCGPEKGILCSEEKRIRYEELLTATEPVKNSDTENVLMLSEHTWLYLWVEKPVGAFSTWLNGVNETTIDRLDQYYRIIPEKRPEMVFVEKQYDHLLPYFENQGYRASETTGGNFILIAP